MADSVKERPILFSGEMVRAIIAGKKTQTRRAIKGITPECIFDGFATDSGCAYFRYPSKQNGFKKCPYGLAGERLWVRETFCPVDDSDFYATNEPRKWVDYRATPRYETSHPAGWENEPDNPDALKWKPSIFMPRWASRITLEITSVGVERLQDIGEADAQAEGVKRPILSATEIGGVRVHPLTGYYVDGYRDLWNKINGSGSWDANPWVWVAEFKRTDGAP